ncbi:thiazole tautomerase (transcriptional regulator TenI) [Halobacillus karajensis]|uniref:Regulatory protein TenI n=1 Tax=Halobacillus karajensis TaxID=195088 RepID=A0A024P630_9BACI|nr:thiamine phosphate synthase [Halobacillus karajensis]CDQ18168.1 Regulatory protein TenI [Halobacillus karajensis]CDQ24519.1 Regulatory protein TenI [Halobacillus karajensis]CDQ29233.1 Regulatory protein TenI [Halobacillus karajensis]SEH57968.1 thiazole tautomerase (transcriptional regulator TenI) [Halobacillus karajensis]
MKLIAVTNGEMCEKQLVEVIIEISPEVDAIILREKQLVPKAYLSLVKQLIERGVDRRKLWIHDRSDLACMTGIHNLHLPEKGLPVREVKGSFPWLNVGVSVHSLEFAKQAEEQGADYIMFGHIFSTLSKKGSPPQGIQKLAEVTDALTIPVVAIGGITEENIHNIRSTSVSAIAVMSGIFDAESPIAAVKKLRREMGHSE